MARATKIISSSFDSLKRRILKFYRLGKDVQTAHEVAPYGFDSNPIKGMTAIHMETGNNGDTVVVGYVNLNQLAGSGESRMYSTDANGVLKTSIWLKNDGIMEIGGDVDFMVRYSKLAEAFNELKDDHNKLVDAFNMHVHAGNNIIATVSVDPKIPADQSNADIEPAKIVDIKTK
jgi:hypothetical protein